MSDHNEEKKEIRSDAEPEKTKGRPTLGQYRGRIWVSNDFDDPFRTNSSSSANRRF